ncbi:MAG: zinc ribbon domain-containing protein [Ruminococcaceae bacterium]|nr:zinc ribbon domain-containing protein [Oscillospiraceae bacterium]
MAKFCEKCGKPLGDAATCPHCDRKRTKGKGKRIVTILLLVLSIYTALLITGGVLVYFDKISIPFLNDIFLYMGIKDETAAPLPATEVSEETAEPTQTPENTLADPYKVTPPDVNELFAQTATVLETIPARDSSTVQAETAAYKNLTDRGFSGDGVTTMYDMDGVYSEQYRISSSSSERHPMYQTAYQSAEGIYWEIYEINGAVFANPVSYNLERGEEVPVILSESESIVSYDSTTNSFYVIIPKTLSVKTVEKIDAQSLDMLTKGAIDAL